MQRRKLVPSNPEGHEEHEKGGQFIHPPLRDLRALCGEITFFVFLPGKTFIDRPGCSRGYCKTNSSKSKDLIYKAPIAYLCTFRADGLRIKGEYVRDGFKCQLLNTLIHIFWTV
jgi:hypothetical protein